MFALKTTLLRDKRAPLACAVHRCRCNGEHDGRWQACQLAKRQPLYETMANTHWRSFDIISRCIPMKCISVGHRSSSSSSLSSSSSPVVVIIIVFRCAACGGQETQDKKNLTHTRAHTSSHTHARRRRNVYVRAAMIFRILFVDFYVSSFCVRGSCVTRSVCVCARANDVDDIKLHSSDAAFVHTAISRKILIEHGMW